MFITHNLLAMNAERQFGVVVKNKRKSTEKLSSGYKINRAADNAAGLSISEKMRNQIRGLNQGSKNLQDGISFCNTAEGALNEVHNILGRMKELSVKAANDTNASEDRRTINDEIEQLKKEINRISRSTEFNSYKIFDKGFAIEFSDNIQVVQIFDANNGNPSDPNSYGGIIINGKTRIPWDQIDPDMVNRDPVTNEVTFNAGTYPYNTGSCSMIITCEDGSKPPQINVEFPVEIGPSGISVAGENIPWSQVQNDDGTSILNKNPKDDYYHFPYGDGMGTFAIKDCTTMDDVIKGLKNYNKSHDRKYMNIYDGYYTAQAVDITDKGSQARITQDMVTSASSYANLNPNLRADNTGIWVAASDGTEISGSKKTWADLGINSWSQGSDIDDANTYHYAFSNADNNVRFDFTLIDETSLQSVIDGINRASANNRTDITNNSNSLIFTAQNHLSNGTIISENNQITVAEQIALERNFDNATGVIGTANLSYDSAGNSFEMAVNKPGTTDSVISYTSSSVTGKNAIKQSALDYMDYLVARKVQQLLSGGALTFPDMSDSSLLGTGHVTSSGHLTEALNITSGMHTTGNINPSASAYPSAHLDFSELGTKYQLYDLLGTGFNSTCMTCSNHYSVMFTYGTAQNTTPDGYGYSTAKNGNDYMLKIDMKTIMDSGRVQTGADLANALVDILDDSGFDFHFTQYAADGANFYICDNRTSTLNSTNASFDTAPYSISSQNIQLQLKETAGSRSLKLSYDYDLTGTVDVFVSANADGSLNITNSIETSADHNQDWENFYDNIMNDIANQSKIRMQATDYAYMKFALDERSNSATVSKFDFQIHDNEKGFWIQSGANQGEGLSMEWDTFNTYLLGIGNVDVLTHKSASNLIGKVDYATKKISALRSGFGAYTNRMEYMYANNTNYSENLQSAESLIRDTDMAEEVISNSKAQILQQVGQSMIAQANQNSQTVLNLLQ